MSLLTGQGVAKFYGSHEVIKNISFKVEHGDCIGLVGPNGEGKTTLLRLLVDLEDPSEGVIQGKRGLRIGYLPQDPPMLSQVTLWEYMLEVFTEVRRMEKELQQLAGRLEGNGDSEQLLAQYSALQAEFERLEGYTYELRMRTVLSGLGFDPDHFEHPLANLSGGQRTRALLARLLLDGPDLLLLDEPTNHLDLQAVEWLESWVQAFKGSLVVVSHDRYFLDAVTNRTWEMAFKSLEIFRGNYSAYVRQREARYKERRRKWEEQQEHIAKTEDFIRRHIAGQRTKEAQGRRTRLERFMRDEAIDRPQQPQHIRVRLNPVKRSGDIVLQLRNLTIGYESGKPLLSPPEIEARRGQRIAVVGPNGAGKTTLMRTILGQLEPLAGDVRIGASVEIGYLSQTHDYLDPEMEVLDALLEVDPQMKAEQGRNLLGSFLFKGDDVFKRIGEVSGGQRSRVALARLVIQDANFLVLDEPTNHLDIASQEILQEVLQSFTGTLLLVSHDRYLIQGLATHVWVVEDGALHFLEGGWEEYATWRSEGAPAVAQKRVREDRQTQREEQKEVRRVRKQTERLLGQQQKLEDVIQGLEEEMSGLSERIGKAGEVQDMDQVHHLGAEYRQIEKKLEGRWGEWEGLVEALEGEG